MALISKETIENNTKIDDFISWLKNPKYQHGEWDFRFMLKKLLEKEKNSHVHK